MLLPRFSIVIPVYCEASSLRQSLAEIYEACACLEGSFEIIIVDDGSVDKSWQILEELSAIYPEMKALRLSRNFGKESAISAGLRLSHGEAVITMDADLQHPPSLIPEMVSIWNQTGVNVVEAVKRDRGREPLIKKLGARIFYRSIDRLSGFQISRSSDFKLMDRRVVEALNTFNEKNLFFRGMIAWLGFDRTEIAFDVPSRGMGSSKWSLYRLTKLAITAISAFSSVPLQLVTLMGVLVFLTSVILGTQALILKFTGSALEGFTTVIILQLFIGSLLMISLGIIGIYLSRVFEEVKGRPRYIVSHVIGNGRTNGMMVSQTLSHKTNGNDNVTYHQ